MPYVKKEEYNRLTNTEKSLAKTKAELAVVNSNSLYYQDRLNVAQTNYRNALESLHIVRRTSAMWERYFKAASRVFKIDEYVEMPGCFNPMESIEYIAKRQAEQQEETKDEVNRHGC